MGDNVKVTVVSMPKGFCYVVRMEGGKRYVGATKNIDKRTKQHCNGTGARATSEHRIVDVVYKEYATFQDAKRAETQLYYRQKKKYGCHNVRGAGNTARFSKKKKKIGRK